MGGSYATAAFNVGAAAGPLAGAAALRAAVGPVGPLWASGCLVLVALLATFPLRGAVTAGRSGGGGMPR